MINNPFSSKTFTTIWVKHFRPLPQMFSFPMLNGIRFYKHPWLPLYTNVGRNMTKGMLYSADNNKNGEDLRNKVCLIYDVPKHFKTGFNLEPKKIKRHRIPQYPGFLLDVAPFKDFTDYMAKTFSKSSRYKLNKYRRRLESSFNIRYTMYNGEMDKGEYLRVFDQFEDLLRKRFLQKQITNNNLEPAEWNFYKEATYPMILEKDAALFVVYNGETPIAVTLNYIQGNTLIDAITVFDIDYEKFHLGSVNIMKLIEWTLDNKLGFFDFSKGYYEYKKRWTNKEYDFEYHLIYDSSSPLSTVLAWNIKLYFQFKQYLRSKDLNTKFHSLTFLLRNRKPVKEGSPKFSFTPLEDDLNLKGYKTIPVNKEKWNQLRSMISEFLYLHNESEQDLIIYQNSDKINQFIFRGKNKDVLLTILTE